MIKAILFDISGVLHVDNVPVNGAVELIKALQKKTFSNAFCHQHVALYQQCHLTESAKDGL